MRKRTRGMIISALIVAIFATALIYGLSRDNVSQPPQKKPLSPTTPTLAGLNLLENRSANVTGTYYAIVNFTMPDNVTEIYLKVYSNGTQGNCEAVDPNGHIMVKLADESGNGSINVGATFSDPPQVVIYPGSWQLKISIIGSGSLHYMLACKK